MAVHVPGLVAIIVFYLIILGVGVYVAWRKRKRLPGESQSENAMIANRDLGLFVGMFTTTATWVGGGYINGTAEKMYDPKYGLVWCQAPIGYTLSLVIGGLFFAKQMRSKGYITMLDPFQDKYGSTMSALLYIPAVMGDIFWSAAVLSALGSSLAIIAGLDEVMSVVVSGCIAMAYTLCGGMFSVAYTDIAQLGFMFIALWLCVPFAMSSGHTVSIATTRSRWMGSLVVADVGRYVDLSLQLILGGIPWQVYFQRVLASRTARNAQIMSFAGAAGCFVMALPPFLLGAVGASTNWTSVSDDFDFSLPKEDSKLVLPMVLQYLCPVWVAFIGVGAVSAAVMSSADSAILSASTLFARNIYKLALHRSATDAHVMWAMRVCIPAVAAVSMLLAVSIRSVYNLFLICSDLVYVLLFPQLACVLYVPLTNTYGALSGYVVALMIRLSAGEAIVGLPPLIYYTPRPQDGSAYVQQFPIKTVAMAVGMCTCVGVSLAVRLIFKSNFLSKKYDVMHCFNTETDRQGYGRELTSSDQNDAFMNARDKLISKGKGKSEL